MHVELSPAGMSPQDAILQLDTEACLYFTDKKPGEQDASTTAGLPARANGDAMNKICPESRFSMPGKTALAKYREPK